MTAPAFERLGRVLAAVRAAAEARLAGTLARRAACLERAGRLRSAAAARGPGGDGPPPDAATLLATAAWRARLLREAAAEEARARDLERAADPLRRSLAQALGRERAAGDLAERARAEGRRAAMRRAEAAAVPRGQPRSSSSDASAGETGSPGIA